jgi:hypothetical protein
MHTLWIFLCLKYTRCIWGNKSVHPPVPSQFLSPLIKGTKKATGPKLENKKKEANIKQWIFIRL